MPTIAHTEQAIRLARKHVHEGARLCLAEAVEAMDRQDYTAAHRWAQRSLAAA